MSSPVFSIEIQIDRRLRQLVMACGITLFAAGAWLLAGSDLPIVWRALLLASWFADCLWTLRRLRRGAQRLTAVRLDSTGSIIGRGPEGRSERLRLASGSMVMQRFAWLRLEFDDGSQAAEMLLARRAGDASWHGLQLLWQQCRDSFGQSSRA